MQKPSPAELAVALGSRASLIKQNLLATPGPNDEPPEVNLRTLKPPDPSAGLPEKEVLDPKLEHSRVLVHKYLAALPNFTADEAMTFYSSPKLASPRWKVEESMRTEAVFHGGEETRRNVVINGVKWEDTAFLPSAVRANPSTLRLSQIFRTDCQVIVGFEKRVVEAGTPMLVYRFAAPRDLCFGEVYDNNYQRYFPGYEGEVFVAEADGLTRRIECASSGFPAEFNDQRVEERTAWDQVKIGDESHLLPVSAERLVVTKSVMLLSVAKYSNHRHFEASTSITFH